jgi:hypothetical protein
MLDTVHCDIYIYIYIYIYIFDTHDPIVDYITAFKHVVYKNTGLAQKIYNVLTQYWYKMWLL